MFFDCQEALEGPVAKELARSFGQSLCDNRNRDWLGATLLNQLRLNVFIVETVSDAKVAFCRYEGVVSLGQDRPEWLLLRLAMLFDPRSHNYRLKTFIGFALDWKTKRNVILVEPIKRTMNLPNVYSSSGLVLAAKIDWVLGIPTSDYAMTEACEMAEACHI